MLATITKVVYGDRSVRFYATNEEGYTVAMDNAMLENTSSRVGALVNVIKACQALGYEVVLPVPDEEVLVTPVENTPET